MDIGILYTESLTLLKQLIAIPSLSREEDRTASLLCKFIGEHGIAHSRAGNNVWAFNKYFDPALPSILLNSHHDTVKPNADYTRDPFDPAVAEGKLFGLGSNDAGGCLVSLLAAFRYFYEQQHLKYNLVFAATAEEEISGLNGIESILQYLPAIDFAIVGEPTLTDLAIAERGLLVLDCTSYGRAGHAAREEGDNAIYKAMKDISWFRDYHFHRVSEVLGPVKMSVTVIHAGQQHNVVPPVCNFTVDVRVTDEYTHEEVLAEIGKNVSCGVVPRSMRIRSSKIDKGHPAVRAGLKIGKKLYGSPTTSDQALIPAPSLKMGPGDSARSHMADEFIYLHEIEEGIKSYIGLLNEIMKE